MKAIVLRRLDRCPTFHTRDSQIQTHVYLCHLKEKSYARCVFGILSPLGNVPIWIYDFCFRGYNHTVYVLCKVAANGLNLRHASWELRNDDEVVRADLLKTPQALKYAHPRFRSNPTLAVDVLERGGGTCVHFIDPLLIVNDAFIDRLRLSNVRIDQGIQDVLRHMLLNQTLYPRQTLPKPPQGKNLWEEGAFEYLLPKG